MSLTREVQNVRNQTHLTILKDHKSTKLNKLLNLSHGFFSTLLHCSPKYYQGKGNYPIETSASSLFYLLVNFLFLTGFIHIHGCHVGTSGSKIVQKRPSFSTTPSSCSGSLSRSKVSEHELHTARLNLTVQLYSAGLRNGEINIGNNDNLN